MTATASINIEALNGPELVSLYNKLTGESVKKFSDRKAGIRRVLEAQKRSKVQEKPATIAVKRETVAKPASTLDGPARRKLISFPAATEVKPHRPGTKRAQVIDLLRKGATIGQVMTATGWGYKDAYDGIKLLHVYLGHGLEENERGVITLTD